MKLLILSWYFPPSNTMGALRVGKLAKYLLAAGHEVRVVTARDLPFRQTLPLEISEKYIFRMRWRDINAPLKAVQRVRVRLRGGARTVNHAVGSAAGHGNTDAQNEGLLRRMRQFYQFAFNMPDPQIGWLPGCLKGGDSVLRDFRPDLIFASAPPHTVLIAADRLAHRHSIPWVAEYRDRWTEDPYDPPPPWRSRLDRWIEDRVIGSATAIVTVSEPWAEDYRTRWRKPVQVVYNGFDPDDFPLDPPRAPTAPDRLEIVYTGILYPDRRDPSPLFRALAAMGEEADGVRVRFYGADPAVLGKMIERHGVQRWVEVHGSVPYRDSIRLQMEADVLLLLQWNDPREQGNCPGKLFEYVAARRPVLALGLEGGVPDTILRERDAGVLANDPAAIAQQLRRWMAEKRRQGALQLLPEATRAGLSRPEQFERLEQFLAGLVAGGAATAPAQMCERG